MDDKDFALKDIFYKFVTNCKTSVCKCLLDNEVYYISNFCVYKGFPTGEDQNLMERKIYPYSDELPVLKLSDLSRANPDVILTSNFVPIKDEASKLLMGSNVFIIPVEKSPIEEEPPGLWVIQKQSVDAFRRLCIIPYTEHHKLINMAIRPYAINDSILRGLKEFKYSLEDFNGAYIQPKLGNAPLLILTSETGMLYVTMLVCEKNSGLSKICLEDGTVIVGDAWDDASQAFKKLIKQRSIRRSMKGLVNPLAKTNKEKAKETVETPEEIKQEKPVTPTATTLPEVPKEIEIPTEEEVKPQGASPLEQAPQEDGPEPEAAVVQKKTRKPRTRAVAKALGLDLSKVMEDLSAPVEALTAGEIDQAKEDLRALRDLQIAASRRAANIAAEVIKVSRTALDAFAKMQEFMKDNGTR